MTDRFTIEVQRKSKGSLILKDADGGEWCPHCHGFLLDGVDARSLEQLKLFHGFVRHLRLNWPTEHRFHPEGATKRAEVESLRAWITARAGCVQPGQIHTWENEEQRENIIRVLQAEKEFNRRKGRYCWVKAQDDGIAIWYPRSIAIYGPNKMGQEEFNEAVERVFDAAYAEAGIDVDEWKKKKGNGR